MTRLHRSNRLAIESLENRIAPAANISIIDAYPVDANNNPITPKAGDQVFIHADFTTQNLPSDASYAVNLTVDGTTYGPTLTWGAGLSGTGYWNLYWGAWNITSGWHTVTVAFNPNLSVAESTYSDNTTSFQFLASGFTPIQSIVSVHASARATTAIPPSYSFNFGTDDVRPSSAPFVADYSYSAAANRVDGTPNASPPSTYEASASTAEASIHTTVNDQSGASQSGTITIGAATTASVNVANTNPFSGAFAESDTSGTVGWNYWFSSDTAFTLTLHGNAAVDLSNPDLEHVYVLITMDYGNNSKTFT
jgi:hypothetical protein